jgi:hypothetical protein
VELAKNLRLSIDLEEDQSGRWLKLYLNDDFLMAEAQIDHPLDWDEKDKSYRIREGLVIAMRRLMDRAISAGMIALDQDA